MNTTQQKNKINLNIFFTTFLVAVILFGFCQVSFAASAKPMLLFTINDSSDYLSTPPTDLTFKWNSANVTSCTATTQPAPRDDVNKNWNGGKNTNAYYTEQVFVGTPGDTTYTLACSDGTNTVSKSITINIPYQGQSTSGAISTLSCSPQNISSFNDFIMNLVIGCILSPGVKLLIALAVVVFLWGVFNFIRASDDSKKSEGKKLMLWGIIGLFVIVSIWGIVSILQNTFIPSGRTTPRNVVIPEIKI